MKYIFTCLFMMAALTFFTASVSNAQDVPPQDTSKHLPVANAGFDVIIKRNGDILYGLVKEVGQELIKYQRTDIPDGPIYTVQRSEVYAISYRNQVKDILNPLTPVTSVKDTVAAPDTTVRHDTTTATSPPVYTPYTPTTSKPSSFFRNGNVRIGIGFIRSYTGVSHVSQYSSSAAFPIISIGYDVRYQEQLRLGLQVAFGPHRFSKQEYSSYDSTQSNVSLKETIFTLHVYGKYSFLSNTTPLQPYILVGLGINSSHINSIYDINFITNFNKVQVKSGNNSVGLGIMARIGAEYLLNNQLRVFGDVGFGASVINIGIATNLD